MGKRPGSSGFNGTRKKGGRGHGPGGKMMPGEKAKDFKGTMKKLIRYLAPHKFALIAVFIFAIASTVFNIISPTILGNATDKVVEGLMSGTGIDFTGLFHILMVLLGMYGLCLLFGALQGWIMADVSQTVIYELRDAMSKKLDRLPLKYFDRQTHGEIQSRMVNDIETVNQTLSMSLNADDHQFYDDHRDPHYDAAYQCHHDRNGACSAAALYACDQAGGIQVSGTLRKSAEISGICKRACRGNVYGT